MNAILRLVEDITPDCRQGEEGGGVRDWAYLKGCARRGVGGGRSFGRCTGSGEGWGGGMSTP